MSPLVCRHSLHAISGWAWKKNDADIRLVIQSEMGVNVWTTEWFNANPNLVDRLAKQAHGWPLYARELASFLAEDIDEFYGRLEILIRPDTHFLDKYNIRELRPFVDALRKMCTPAGISLAGSYSTASRDLLHFLFKYIPDPSDIHQVTPRMLSLVTQVSKRRVLKTLYRFRSTIVFERLDADSALYLLHPVCRKLLADCSSDIEQWRSGSAWKNMQRQLTIVCVRNILYPLSFIPLDILLSSSELTTYTNSHTPPAVSDPGDLLFAFEFLQKNPIRPNLIGSVPEEDDRMSLETFMKMSGAVRDELYLWLCVVSGMTGTSPSDSGEFVYVTVFQCSSSSFNLKGRTS
ncbi:hypothetical protein C8Q80DRAFT_174858 [Daedaleopsis nitida]|nr:hypothetical protein C8Q80DRAFT_174858 [Daedaleopsis nitida]